MQKIKYSFVLPAYKARFFSEALDSILAQTYKDFELIIVNDASPDDLDSIVKSYDDPRIRYYVNEQNIGGKDLVAQWNHCLEYAEGEYVILASDDDIYFPQYLEKMDALVQKYPDVNVFRPRVQYIDAKGQAFRVYGMCEERISAIEYVYVLRTFIMGSGIPFYVFRRSSLLGIGGFINFPMAWGSDDATAMELSRNGVVVANEILFSFRNSGENISSKKNDYNSLVGKLKAYKLMYNFERNYMATLDATTVRDKQHLAFLQGNQDNIIRILTAEMIHQTSFFTLIKAIPVLLKVPGITPIFVIKRIIRKIL